MIRFLEYKIPSGVQCYLRNLGSPYTSFKWYEKAVNNVQGTDSMFSIFYIFTQLVVCLFVSNTRLRLNGWTYWAQILCGTSHDPREGLWVLRIKQNVSSKMLDFCKILKVHKKNCKSAKFLFFHALLYFMTQKTLLHFI